MSSSGYPLLFLILASYLVTTKSSEANFNQTAAVHIFNRMPKNYLPMQIFCKTSTAEYLSGAISLSTGDVFHAVNEKGKVYFCLARTGNATASWPAFLAKRDPSPGNVYWLLKEDGLYVSWDKATWEKKYAWETK